MSDERKGGRELGPLRGGRHGLSREQVAESQRERLLAAIVQVVAANGYRSATIKEIAKTASVSSRDFYESFKSKEECFLAAMEVVVDHLRGVLAAAVADEPDWPRQTIAGLRAALRFFGDEPELTRVFVLDAITASPPILVRRGEAILELAPFLARGREERSEAEPLPESTEESILGGLVVMVARSIGTGRSLESVFPDLVDFVLAPYLGPELASELAETARKEGDFRKR